MTDSVSVLRGFRIVHNDARGPAKGGIRFHPQETIDTVRALAMWMTWKCALIGIPLGGSSGGVVCDPHFLSLSEQERLCRGWVRQLPHELGPNVDVPAPDMMTSAQHMLWMLDEYEAPARREMSRDSSPASRWGWAAPLGRAEATGFGAGLRPARGAQGAGPPGRRHDGERSRLRQRRPARRPPLSSRWEARSSAFPAGTRRTTSPMPIKRTSGIDVDALAGITDRSAASTRRRPRSWDTRCFPEKPGWPRTWIS